MARLRKVNRSPSYDKRTSWTRFHLPRGQEWPAWSSSYSDTYRGPLEDAPGCLWVWLGRKVEDPEQAVVIVLWQTPEDLRKFQHSPAGAQFLRDLPEHEAEASAAADASPHQKLSLGDNDAKGAASLLSSPLSPHHRFLTLKWEAPYIFESNLQGRITITALEVAHAGNDPDTDESWLQARDGVFGHFVPAGFEDVYDEWPRIFMRDWRTWAMVVTEEDDASAQVDSGHAQAGQQAAGSSSSGQSGLAVWCEFRRWKDSTRATPEWEEALAQSPLARESWAQAVAQVTPPVTAWEQERWDVRLIPAADEGEDDSEFRRKLVELCKGKRVHAA